MLKDYAKNIDGYIAIYASNATKADLLVFDNNERRRQRKRDENDEVRMIEKGK